MNETQRAFEAAVRVANGQSGIASAARQGVLDREGYRPTQKVVERVELSMRQLLAELAPTIPTMEESHNGNPFAVSSQRNDNATGTAPELLQWLTAPLEDLPRKTPITQLGAQFVNHAYRTTFPYVVDGLEAHWTAEGQPVEVSAFDMNEETGDPKQVGVHTSWSRRLLKQTSEADQRTMMRHVIRAILEKLMTAAIYGSGEDEEPTGIYSRDGIQRVTIAERGQPTAAELAQMVRMAKRVNRSDRLIFAVSPEIEEFLTTPAVTNTAMENGLILGKHDYIVIQDLEADDFVVAQWDQLEMIVFDTLSMIFEKTESGASRVVALVDCDIKINYENAFVVADYDDD